MPAQDVHRGAANVLAIAVFVTAAYTALLVAYAEVAVWLYGIENRFSERVREINSTQSASKIAIMIKKMVSRFVYMLHLWLYFITALCGCLEFTLCTVCNLAAGDRLGHTYFIRDF